MRTSWLLFAAVTAVGSVVAVSLPALTLVVNGKETPNGAVTVGKEMYVSLAALEKSGAQVSNVAGRVTVNFAPLGGRNQVDAIEGDLGEWLQNDGWRIRVESIRECPNPYGKGPGYALEVEIRNVHPKAVSPFASGMDKLQIIDAEGNIVAFSQTKFKPFFSDIAPGGGTKASIEFGDPANKIAALGKAEKLLIFFRQTGKVKLKDFRVFLAKE